MERVLFLSREFGANYDIWAATKQSKSQYWVAAGLGFFIALASIFIAFQVTKWHEARPDVSLHQKIDVILDTPFATAFDRRDINLLNWQHWPYSRYASHHPREFIPMATLHSAPEAPALDEVKNDPFNLIALKVSVDEEKDVLLPDLLKSVQMKGFIVLYIKYKRKLL